MKVSKLLRLVPILFFFLLWFVPASPVEAQLSRARCDLAVYPGTYVTDTNYVAVHGRVTETRPGLDPSTTYIDIWTSSGGNDTKYGQDSVEAYIPPRYFPNGTHYAYIEGTAWSNPNGGTSNCGGYVEFTVNVPEPVYVCSNDSDDDGDGLKDMNDPGCDNPQDPDEYNAPPPPPPGSFNMTSSACYGWPSPAIEANFNPSSGANYYVLQKWNGGGWSDIYTGSYQQIDNYGDTSISMGNTYYYQVVAFNDAGSTASNGYLTQEATAANCGQVIYNVSVGVSPSGAGTVTGTVSQATGSGISCASDCSENYDQRDPWVTLTAAAVTGYTFSSWSGACATQTSSCSLQMNQNRSTTANFTTNNYALSVSVSGPGSVSSNPSGITNCTSQCSANFPYPQQVILTPTPTNAGVTFAGWSGACSGSGACNVTMNAARSVTATFTTNSYLLSLTKNGSGTGTVTSSPGGISCGTSCSSASANFDYSTSVTLTPSEAAGSGPATWSGCTSMSGNNCIVSMTQARSVTATFNTVPFNYSLSNGGTISVTKGSGNVPVQGVITKNLIAGITQSVDLTVSNVPPATSYNISNRTCSPTCSSTITFTVSPSTPAGTYAITVTGLTSPQRTTTFNLVITGSPFTVSCTATPASPTKATLGQSVTYSSTVVGGRAPLTYTWSGTNVPTSPAPSTATYTRSYSTIGTKTAAVTVRDADNVQSTCPAATVEVTFDPNFEEF